MKRFLLCLVCVIAFSFSVSAAENPVAANSKALVSAAKQVVNEITPQELYEMIKGKADFVLIDVRTKGEVDAAKIEAKDYYHVDRGLLEFLIPKMNIPTDKLIVTYCKVGGRGVLAAETLKRLGYEKVVNLKGGIKGWIEAGLPVTNSMGTFKMVPYELTGCAE
ncbi:MAG: Rhodanese domain protein [Deferribacteraceae bacterium]|jgi:rhodanese-related sulfurtransferase|nr:Rhodanese domain protein [Deferribacteraceae bacterium]